VAPWWTHQSDSSRSWVLLRIPRPAIELERSVSPDIGRVGFIKAFRKTSAAARSIVAESFVEGSQGFLLIVIETILIGFDEDWLDNKSLVDGSIVMVMGDS
jgi:hypothetical protein